MLTRPEDLPVGAKADLIDDGVCEVSAHEDGIVVFHILTGVNAGQFAAFHHDDLPLFEHALAN